MAEYIIQEETLDGIADAIRSKTHRTSNIFGNNLKTEILGIPQNTYNITNPFTPKPLGYSNLTNAYRALKCAMTYWNQKASGGETFEYVDGQGPLKGSTSAVVRDSSGNAVIDCSTYIGLVLRGYEYLNSPYGTSLVNDLYGNLLGNGVSCDPRDIVCLDATWTETYFDLQDNRFEDTLVFPTFDYQTNDGKYRVITASDIAQYYDRLGLFWYASDNTMTPQVGDICFFNKENSDGTLVYPSRFHGISHVGIMTNPDYYLNATDYDASGDLIRTAVSTRPPVAYARPYYGALTDGSSEELSGDLDLIPNGWAGLPDGTTTGNNSCQLKINAKKLTVTGTGTGAAHSIISTSCPLYLPAGTYTLSGVTNNTGGNTTTNHSYFGIRVYDTAGNGITGTTWTSNGASSYTRTPVWDIGGGAEFTLNSPTNIVLDVYLSANKTFSGLTIEPKLTKKVYTMNIVDGDGAGLGDITITYEPNMTWAEWVNSSYNTYGFTIDEVDYVVYGDMFLSPYSFTGTVIEPVTKGADTIGISSDGAGTINSYRVGY